MPIRPENRDRYPPDWPSISVEVRERAGWRCECQGECGRWHGWTGDDRCGARQHQPHPVTGSRVVLTVAHLDHTPENCDRANLRAMCQRCHLNYDADHHAETAARIRAAEQVAAGQLTLKVRPPCCRCTDGYACLTDAEYCITAGCPVCVHGCPRPEHPDAPPCCLDRLETIDAP